MLIFKSVVGLVFEGELVGLRVQWVVKTYDISLEALATNGLTDFKPTKSRKLKPHDGLLLTDGEIVSGKRIMDKSSDNGFVRGLVGYIKVLPRIIADASQANLSPEHKSLVAKLDPLRGTQIFTNNFGDGEIELVLLSKDGANVEVLFHSNGDGQVTLTAEELLADIA
jgi:hypothetical protein